jgi:alkaline phosphatase
MELRNRKQRSTLVNKALFRSNCNPAMPGTFTASSPADAPWTSTYSTYYGSPAYKLDAASGYPVNSGSDIRRLAVGFRTGDHTGSSVPVTAGGPGAFLFTGYMDQTDIFFKMAAAISSDTSDADKLVDAMTNSAFPRTVGKK